MRILALETSGRLGSIALLQSGGDGVTGLLAERQLPADQRTARSLLPEIQTLLADHSWRPADVELICATTGPGSFTGLRIGVVAAKTWAYATAAHLMGVHTLAAMAEGAGVARGRLWAVLDAQRQELFVAALDMGRPIVEQCVPQTEILPRAEWLGRLLPGDSVCGPPLAKLVGQLPAGVVVAHGAGCSPSAAAVGRLGAAMFARGMGVDPLQLAPQYYRPSAAEEKAGASADN